MLQSSEETHGFPPVACSGVQFLILRSLGKPETSIAFVKDRPGHDRRYPIDSSKTEDELGWQRRWSFERRLAATIDWYRTNSAWLDEPRSGAYREYFDKHYKQQNAGVFNR